MMQKIFFLFLSLFTGIFPEAQSLRGNVIDSANHQALAGAAVYFPQLKVGTLTDIKGNYKITRLPKGVYEVELEMVGYAALTKEIAINDNVTFDFVMTASTATLKEVLITSLGNATTVRRAPVPVTVISHDMFVQQSSTNVIDAIAKQLMTPNHCSISPLKGPNNKRNSKLKAAIFGTVARNVVTDVGVPS